MEYARDGQIVLNIAPRAVGNLELANDEVRFNARFGGVPRQGFCTAGGSSGNLCRKNGAGTMFEPEAAYDEDVASLNDDDNDAHEVLRVKRSCRSLMAISLTMATTTIRMTLRRRLAVGVQRYA